MASSAESVKQQAHELLDKLPESTTWDDIVYELAVRRSIERGLNDADSGKLLDMEKIRREYK